jgi:hypothetical protein
MLHYPFRQLTDLLSFDGSYYGSYTDAFQACRQLHTYTDDVYTDLGANSQDTDSKDKLVCNESDNEPLANFKLFACRRPRDDLTYSFIYDLGSRYLDCAYDWTSHVGRDIMTVKAWD